MPAIASALAASGHDVEVVCLSDSVRHDDARYPFRVKRLERGGAKARRFVTTVSTLAARAKNADLIYANGLSLEAQSAGHLRRVPVVHKVVGDQAWERARNHGWYNGTIDEYQRTAKGARLKLLDRLRSAPLRHGAAIITPSRYLREIVAGWGVEPDSIHVVYNALPRENPPSATVTLPPFAGQTIITVCRLVPWKGVDTLIDLVAERCDWRLVVVGDGPLRGNLERSAAEAGAADRVLWMGTRSADEVQALFGLADLFVLNSSYEGLPHVLLEAMRAGVPVAATAVGGTPEVVRDGITGRLIRPGDSGALRRVVAEVFSTPAESKKLAANALDQLQTHFRFETMAAQTERVLMSVVRGGRSAVAS